MFHITKLNSSNRISKGSYFSYSYCYLSPLLENFSLIPSGTVLDLRTEVQK